MSMRPQIYTYTSPVSQNKESRYLAARTLAIAHPAALGLVSYHCFSAVCFCHSSAHALMYLKHVSMMLHLLCVMHPLGEAPQKPKQGKGCFMYRQRECLLHRILS